MQPGLPSDAPCPEEPGEWAGLMARAQGGDAAAYRALLDAIVPWLRRLAMRALRHPAEAEDAVQDILLTLHRVRHTFDAERPFRPWLGAIAQARIADRQRAGVRRVRREEGLDERHVTLAGIDTKHDESTDHDRLHRAIAALPEGEQRALRLLKLEELSLKEASLRTGISIVALKVACHRAVKRLRRLMDPAT